MKTRILSLVMVIGLSTFSLSAQSEKSDIHNIHQAIAKAGHDTKMHKAEDRVYEELPGCCKYERMSSVDHKH